MQSIFARRSNFTMRAGTRALTCRRELSRISRDAWVIKALAASPQIPSWDLASKSSDYSSQLAKLQRISKDRRDGDIAASWLWAMSAGAAMTALSWGRLDASCSSDMLVELGDVESFKEGTMTAVPVGPEGKTSVLVANPKGTIHVTGASSSHCSHPQIPTYFQLGPSTSLTYPTEIDSGKLFIRVPQEGGLSAAAKPAMARRSPEDDRVFAIVGGGAAALAAAETLRQEGFTGRVVMLTQESTPPYDRPLLSKKLQAKAEDNLLRPRETLADWDIEILHSVQVRKVDSKMQSIEYRLPDSRDTETLKYDKVLVATGGSASRLFVPGGNLPGIFTMRTPKDAEGLAQVAHPGYKIVVVGGSFIGMELASTLKARGCEVTIVAKETVPFEHVLGKKIGAAYARLLQAKEVNWIGNSRVRLFRGEMDTGVSGVELDDGEVLTADAVVLGIGVVPNTKIVEGVSLDKTGGILCGPLLNSKDALTLFAAGDVCSFPSIRTGQSQRIEHWDVAVQQGRIAARNMLDQFVPYTTVPFFWSLAFGNTMRFVGQAPENFDRVYVEGNLSEMDFIAYVAENDDVRAVVTMNRDPIAATCLALMKHKAMPTVSEILVKQVKVADELMKRFNNLHFTA